MHDILPLLDGVIGGQSCRKRLLRPLGVLKAVLEELELLTGTRPHPELFYECIFVAKVHS